MVTIQVMTTFKRNKQHPRKQNQKGSRRHIKHERHCIRVSEAHAFYPRRILTAAVHGASREHGRERLLALFSSSNRRLSPVRDGGGGDGAGDYIRELLLRWRWFFSSALSQAKNPRYITSAFSKCCPLLLQAMPPPRAS